MVSLAGKRVLIIQQRSWGTRIGHYLAKKLAGEGALLAAVTYRKSSHAFHVEQKDVHYEMLISNDAVLEKPELYLRGAPASLEEITSALGIESIWPLIAGSREIGRSYGDGFYFVRRKQLSDEEAIRYIQGAYAYICKLFDEFKPDAVLAPLFAEPSHRMIYHMARMRGIRSFAITDSKIRGTWILSESPVEDAGAFYDRVDELNAGAVSRNKSRAAQYIEQFRESLKRPDYIERRHRKESFAKRIRMQLAPYRRVWQWYTEPTRDRVAPLGATMDYSPPRLILRDHYTKARWTHAANSFGYYPVDRLGKYVYYPLQVEPELTLDVFAPFFVNQVELARAIALSLPADYTLAVKDHPDMVGFRSPEALADLSRLPNVKLVDHRTQSEGLLRGAAVVLAPNSTSLAEAAMYRIPAIQFGNEGTTQKLPNVVKHTDMPSLSRTIIERLAADLATPEYERRLENFVAAAYDEGQEMDYIGVWEIGIKDDTEKIWQLYRRGLELAFM